MEQKFHAVFLCLQHPPECGAADAKALRRTALVVTAFFQYHSDDLPLDEGQRLGEATFTLEGRLLAEVPILAEKAVKRMDFATAFFLLFRCQIQKCTAGQAASLLSIRNDLPNIWDRVPHTPSSHRESLCGTGYSS